MYLGDSVFWFKKMIIYPSLFSHTWPRGKQEEGLFLWCLFPNAKEHDEAVLEKPVLLCFYKLRRSSSLTCHFKNDQEKRHGQEGWWVGARSPGRVWGCELPSAAGPCRPQQEQLLGTANGASAASSSSTSMLKTYFWPLHVEITCDEALIRACCSVTCGELVGCCRRDVVEERSLSCSSPPTCHPALLASFSLEAISLAKEGEALLLSTSLPLLPFPVVGMLICLLKSCK